MNANKLNQDESTYNLEVISKEFINKNVLEVELITSSKVPLPKLSPGDHADFYLDESLMRSYSLLPGRLSPGNWRIAVKIEQNGRGGSVFLRDKVSVGDNLNVKGPRNHFAFLPSPNQLFIAGGIGITALIPMIREAELFGTNWRLYFLGKSEAEMPYLEEIQDQFGEKIVPFVSSLGRKFSAAQEPLLISEEVQIYACGPNSLLEDLEKIMSGPAASRLHLERFLPKIIPGDALTATEFVVYCAKSQVEIIVPEDESILVAADFAGIEVEGDCLEGTCGACVTNIIQGEVIHMDSVLTATERDAGEKMMICVSRASGDRIVLDL